MKRSKKLYILIGVLLVACIATFAVTRHEERRERIKKSDEIILRIPYDSVESLSWTYKSNTLAFHRDGTWLYDEDEAFPVDEDKIKELLKPFEEFGASFTIEDVEDLGQYGLIKPLCTISLKTRDKSYEIRLGDFSKMDSERYVSIGDGKVYLVKKDPLDYFDAALSDLIKHDKPPAFDKVSEIRFSGAEDYSIVYEENSSNSYSKEDVYFAKLDGKSLPLDTSRVKSYLGKISKLGLTDYVTYKATEDELRKYGLDKPELTVAVNYVTKENKEDVAKTFVLHISRDPAEKKASGSKDDDSDKNITAYARVGDSKIVYKISSASYKELSAASYDSLRHLELFWADFADVRQVDISLEGATYSLSSEKKGGERKYYYKQEEVKIDGFRSALSNIKAESFTDEQPEGKKEIGMTIYLDNENFSKVQLALYRYDAAYCLAVVDGKPVSLVKRGNVVDLIEAVHAIILA